MHTVPYTVHYKFDYLEGKINTLLHTVTPYQDTVTSSFAEGYMM